MTQASLIVSLPQLVDLALGSPELGAVNFNILNAVLQVMINQLKLTETTVDFRGPEHERVHALIATAKPGVSLHVTEYEVAADADKRKRNSSVFEQENINKDAPQYSKESAKIPKQLLQKDKPEEAKVPTEKIVVVEPKLNDEINKIPRINVAITEDRYKQLESDIAELKSNMSEIMEMPNNSTLIDAVRSTGGENKMKPVSDMWQILSLGKRVDATEAGVDKLASMVEDLVRDIGAGGGIVGKSSKDDVRASRGSIFGEIANRLTVIEDKMEDMLSKRKPSSVDKGGDKEDASEEDEALRQIVKSLEADLAAITKALKGHSLADAFKDIEEMKEKLLDSDGDQATMDQVTDLEDKLADFTDKFNNLDETYSKQIDALQTELQQLETDLNELLERVNTTTSGANDTGDVGSVTELFNKLVKLQEDMEQVSKTAARLTDEADEKQLIMDALIEQMELLKTTKANREDLEDALADKADNQHMNRKVSHDQFDAACDDLTKSIEETMIKLSQQETMWQTTLEEIQSTIGGKLDKMEFDPLRDFVNKKIKSLQQRLKALLAMKAEQEAAGTKSRILKNVNCISCDKDVVMYKQNQFPTLPAPAAMPCNRSMRPYITYELDAVRKQQKSLPGGSNLNHLESALHEPKPIKEKVMPVKQTRLVHSCNRYCGGSHTVTTASQRVAHIGHFLNQWGPQAVPLDEASIVGTNGQMYKAREGGETSPRKGEQIINAVFIQTDEPREFVQRMSDSIEPTGLSKLSTKERKSTAKSVMRTTSTVQKSVSTVAKERTPEIEKTPEHAASETEHPAGDAAPPEDDAKSHRKSGSASSARKPSKKSTTLSTSSEKRVSIAPKVDSSRASVKRTSQASAKKVSVNEEKSSKSQVMPPAEPPAEGAAAPEATIEPAASGTVAAAAAAEPEPAPAPAPAPTPASEDNPEA